MHKNVFRISVVILSIHGTNDYNLFIYYKVKGAISGIRLYIVYIFRKKLHMYLFQILLEELDNSSATSTRISR